MLTKIYADAPDYRLLSDLVDALRRGAIFIYPTASGYAYCCEALHQRAIEEGSLNSLCFSEPSL